MGGEFFPQPRAQRSEFFSSCVLCVLCVQCASQMPHQRWVGRAAERCSDATSSVGGGRVPPPRDARQCALAGARQCALEGPPPVCVGKCSGFLTKNLVVKNFRRDRVLDENMNIKFLV